MPLRDLSLGEIVTHLLQRKGGMRREKNPPLISH